MFCASHSPSQAVEKLENVEDESKLRLIFQVNLRNTDIRSRILVPLCRTKQGHGDSTAIASLIPCVRKDASFKSNKPKARRSDSSKIRSTKQVASSSVLEDTLAGAKTL